MPPIRLKSEDGLPDLVAQLVFHREHSEEVLYIEVNGKRIAKRYPGETWISLDRNYRVEGGDPSDYDAVTITRLPVQ
jgi:hypothetical protein